jgi:hypothetical protein
MIRLALDNWRNGSSIEDKMESRAMAILIDAYYLIPFIELESDKYGFYNLEKRKVEIMGLSDTGFHRYTFQLLNRYSESFEINRETFKKETAMNILNYAILIDKVVDTSDASAPTFSMCDTKKPVYTLNVNPKSELAEDDRQSIDTDQIPF